MIGDYHAEAGNRYVGRRRLIRQRSAEVGSENDGRRPRKMGRTLQVILILVVSVPVATFGAILGVSTGSDAPSSARDAPRSPTPLRVAPPVFTPTYSPAPSPSQTPAPSPPPSRTQTPAAPTTTPPTPPTPTIPAPGPSVDLAAGKPMTASSTYWGSPGDANDGDVNSFWESTRDLPEWLQVDLGGQYRVVRCVLRLPPSPVWPGRTQRIIVAGSTNGSDYVTIGGPMDTWFGPQNSSSTTVALAPTTVRYLRITFNTNTEVNAGQLSEWQVYAS